MRMKNNSLQFLQLRISLRLQTDESLLRFRYLFNYKAVYLINLVVVNYLYSLLFIYFVLLYLLLLLFIIYLLFIFINQSFDFKNNYN